MFGFFKNLWLIVSIDCEQSARLTSDSFDRKLSWGEKWGVVMHRMICKKSRVLDHQLELMNERFARLRTESNPPVSRPLSELQKSRIRENLRQQ